MKYTEQLHWILDKDCKSGWSEEESRQNIEFVHSLGLKCDSVGWSSLDLGSPRAAEILNAIEAFCRENGWGARGYYTREFAETESQWYAIRFAQAKNAYGSGNIKEVPAEDGGTTEICSLKAYQEQSASPIELFERKLVPERFRNVCLKLGLEDVDFCWAPDKGKYQSQQYFHVYPHHAVSHLARNYRFYYSTKGLNRFDLGQSKRMKELGGSLPRLAEIFYDLHIQLPNCYLASELPGSGFSSAYKPRTRFEGGFQNILIHADTAALLLREKALSPGMLMAVPVLDAVPAGYEILDTVRQMPPVPEFREEMLQCCEQLKATPRPVRMVSEKEALKILRKAKKERKGDFQKAMPKAKTVELSETDYHALAVYYAVANGGFLSEEYELLPHDRAMAENAQFQEALKAEELLEDIPDGIVIAKCPDGDAVLLCRDGGVIRFSHEAPETIAQWPSLAQFVVDAIKESE